jgi:hypothetical protein
LIHGSFEAGTRIRLRGARRAEVADEFKAALNPVPTTVHDAGTIRFGDSLCLLNHGTEILLQADPSGRRQICARSSKQQEEAFRVTTARVLHPCVRNSFMIARADRSDGFEDNLDVHYGQEVWILASSSLSNQVLYLHLEAGSDGGGESIPMLLPRGARRSRWRIIPAPEPPLESFFAKGSEAARAYAAAIPKPGQALRINERVALESVSGGGRLLMSDTELVSTGFGSECRVYAADPLPVWPDLDSEDGPKRATWSFVNDVWADAVATAEASTSAAGWKDEEGDDFADDEYRHERLTREMEQTPAFQRIGGDERHRQEGLLEEFSQRSGQALAQRVFEAIRADGMHGVLRMRMECERADNSDDGTMAARTLQGILVNRGRHTNESEFQALCRALDVKEDGRVVYKHFFDLLEGGVMSDTRLAVVKKAYQKLSSVRTGAYVTADDLMNHWNPRCYPEVEAGVMDETEAFQDFVSLWRVADSNGCISAEVFLAYYRDVAMAYEDPDGFTKMMRTAWDL